MSNKMDIKTLRNMRPYSSESICPTENCNGKTLTFDQSPNILKNTYFFLNFSVLDSASRLK